MTKVSVTKQYLTDIADKIREKNGSTLAYKPSEMALAVSNIPSGYPEPSGTIQINQNGTTNVKDYASANINVPEKTLGTKSIVANGGYPASSDNLDGFSSVSVDVPNSYVAADEGKVVSGGALVAQTAHAEVTQNGTIDTTLNNSVVVNVSGAGGNDNFAVAIGAMNGSVYDAEIDVIGAYAFYRNSAITGAEMKSVLLVRSYAFYCCSALTSVSFPLCTSIGGSAFPSCHALTSVSFPVCTEINSYAFQNCSALTSVSFPLCTSIGGSVFQSCYALTSVSFPACTEIKSYAFDDCYALTNVSFPVCDTIGGSAFQHCSALTSVSFPLCTSIGSLAFQSCSALTSVSFPACTTIAECAFQFCSNLGEISFPLCTYIGTSAFRMNTNSLNFNRALTKVSFPACKTVGTDTFNRCVGLKEAWFNVVYSISNYFMYQCSALESLYLLGSSVATLGSNALQGTPMSDSSLLGYFGSIFVAASLVDSYKAARNWSAYSDRITAYVE